MKASELEAKIKRVEAMKAAEQNEEVIRKVNEHINRCLSKRNIHTPDNSVKLKRTKERMHG